MSAYDRFYRRSIDDRDGFWAEQARLIHWETPPQTICDAPTGSDGALESVANDLRNPRRRIPVNFLAIHFEPAISAQLRIVRLAEVDIRDVLLGM